MTFGLSQETDPEQKFSSLEGPTQLVYATPITLALCVSSQEYGMVNDAQE